MKVYLVGGAVRDELLNLSVSERDWVVVGSTPEELISQGYIPVGKDFPVFLHPETHEEYALARTERKIAKGYKGFEFHASADVSLEDDLRRRDLTINAIAQAHDGELIDPYHGQKDLKSKLLRHVSPAFAEDPVRILRVARLAAKLPEFQVAPETNQLMQQMVENGEVDTLVPERVWKEFERAMCCTQPQRFFYVLAGCSALSKLFPQILLQSSGVQALRRSIAISPFGYIRFAALLHNLDIKQITALCQHYRAPREYSDLALLTAQSFPGYRDIIDTNAEEIFQFIRTTDAIRRPNRFHRFLITCEACHEKDHEIREQLLKRAINAMKNVDTKPLQERSLSNQEFAEQIRQLQIEAIAQELHLDS